MASPNSGMSSKEGSFETSGVELICMVFISSKGWTFALKNLQENSGGKTQKVIHVPTTNLQQGQTGDVLGECNDFFRKTPR